jgi:hypothetical protein
VLTLEVLWEMNAGLVAEIERRFDWVRLYNGRLTLLILPRRSSRLMDAELRNASLMKDLGDRCHRVVQVRTQPVCRGVHYELL